MFAVKTVSPLEGRRSKRRFPVITLLDYTVRLKSRSVRTGQGETINISANGLLFLANEQLPVGTEIALAVQWPVSLEGGIGLKLVARGRIVWTQGYQVAVHFKRSELRTRAIKLSQTACAN